MRYDLHSHTKYSPKDGLMEPKELVKKAIKRGLDGIAVTDHNTIKGGIEAKKYARPDFDVIVGSEIRTPRGEIIGLFLKEEIETRDPERVIAKIKEQNGLVIIPHPFDDLRKSRFHITDDDARFIDAIEVYNSRCVFNKYNTRAEEYRAKHKLGTTAGSDAHFAFEVGLAGVIVETGDLRSAILKGNLTVFHKRSTILKHGLTKGLKIWRKIRSG